MDLNVARLKSKIENFEEFLMYEPNENKDFHPEGYIRFIPENSECCEKVWKCTVYTTVADDKISSVCKHVNIEGYSRKEHFDIDVDEKKMIPRIIYDHFNSDAICLIDDEDDIEDFISSIDFYAQCVYSMIDDLNRAEEVAARLKCESCGGKPHGVCYVCNSVVCDECQYEDGYIEIDGVDHVPCSMCSIKLKKKA